MHPLLVLNSRGDAIDELVEHLREHGFWGDTVPERFDRDLEQAVKYFQQTHLGPKGRFLVVDGVVGPATWWALEKASGTSQRSGILAAIPDKLAQKRRRILQVALAEHGKAVCEVPDGSNRGPDVDKYLPGWARGTDKGPPWCCFFYSWVVEEALGEFPLGLRLGGCAEARRRAVERQLWFPKTVPGERPFPGDAFVMDHGNGHGHIGFVLRVSPDRNMINTVEGNCGNRVKVGLRSLADLEIVGFIDNVPDETNADFETGVVQAASLGGEGTR